MASGTPELAPAPGLGTLTEDQLADLIGLPHELGARGPDRFDCYGIVVEVGRRAGIKMPAYVTPPTLPEVPGFITQKAQLWLPCKPGPGAVVTFQVNGYVMHVGMLLPFDRFIHSWRHSHGVCLEPLGAWKRRIAGCYRPNEEAL